MSPSLRNSTFLVRHSKFAFGYSAVRSSSPGFTLLEVIVSMALIATALVAILELQSQNLDFQSEAGFVTYARLLAQERWAWIEADPDFREGHHSGEGGEDYPGFQYRQEIRKSSSGSNLYEVTLKIFTDEERPQTSYSVSGYLYRGTP